MARSPSLGETSQLAIPAKELDDGIPEPPEPGAAKSEVRSKATGSFDARSFSNRSVGLFDGIRSWSKPSSFQVGGLGLGPREGVSSDFMGLVEKLVHQHQTEMAMCGKKKSFDIPPVTTEWERLCSAGSRFSKRSQEPGQAFSPAAVLMRERKHDLKELDASKLLEAFDEHALQEVSEESWSPAMIATRITSFRKHQWDELKETGCCTKLENFLQSNWYEFFIAFATEVAINSLLASGATVGNQLSLSKMSFFTSHTSQNCRGFSLLCPSTAPEKKQKQNTTLFSRRNSVSAHVIVAFHTATTLNTERCASGPWDERLVDGLRTPSHWTRERLFAGHLSKRDSELGPLAGSLPPGRPDLRIPLRHGRAGAHHRAEEQVLPHVLELCGYCSLDDGHGRGDFKWHPLG
ncbi:unnamed protein product [Durusdinium trenchii]|uniref:Uncharacterized protein n=1 Tax=Durusdinium trenchii TaxID=1381693 RepID=A0ABP0MQD7_9DINO